MAAVVRVHLTISKRHVPMALALVNFSYDVVRDREGGGSCGIHNEIGAVVSLLISNNASLFGHRQLLAFPLHLNIHGYIKLLHRGRPCRSEHFHDRRPWAIQYEGGGNINT